MKRTDLNRRLSDIFDSGRLPVMNYITLQNHERKTISRPLHRHESVCELLLVYKGTGIYHTGKKSFPLQVGDVIYYNQGDLHEVENTGNTEIGTYCIGISNLHIKGIPKNCLVQQDGPFVCHSFSRFSSMLSLCEQIYHLEDGGPEEQISAQLLCTAFIVMAYSLTDLPVSFLSTQQDEALFQKIQRYLDLHYTDTLSLSEIAQAIGCSPSHVSHVFRKSSGTTPMQYVIRRRIGHAQTLLISTSYTVTQIASLVGYDNTNYFSTQFSKVVGMSPTHYRTFYSEEAKGQQDQF